MKNRFVLSGAKRLALIGLLSALLEGGKLALCTIPNVEIVSMLCALYGYVFGLYGVVSVIIFVGAEVLIWGMGTWVLSYLLYFPLLCFVFMGLARTKNKNRFLFTGIAVCMTVLFGVLTSMVDVGLFSSEKIDFWKRFSIVYVRGITFYVIQTVCNLILFLFAFLPLERILTKLKRKYFST